jgi:hypothetical protein
MGMFDKYLILKIDYESWKVDVVSEHTHDLDILMPISAVVDQSNNRNFLIHNSKGFITGNLIGEDVVLNERQEFNVGHLACLKLVETKLCGLSYSNLNGTWSWKYCEIDLITSASSTADISFLLDDNSCSRNLNVSFLFFMTNSD